MELRKQLKTYMSNEHWGNHEPVIAKLEGVFLSELP